MKKYSIRISELAFKDIENLQFAIKLIFKSPLTAHKYTQGILAQIRLLSHSAESFRISTTTSVLKYGYNARCIYYKKMTIIYTVHGSVVLVQRVLPGANIHEEL